MMTVEALKVLLEAGPAPELKPIIELALEGAAHREAQTLQVMGSYGPMLRLQMCKHDHQSKCDEFCPDGGRRARECLAKWKALTTLDATAAETLSE